MKAADAPSDVIERADLATKQVVERFAELRMTSTPSISRDLMRACAPVSCIETLLAKDASETETAGKLKRPPVGEVGKRTRICEACAT